MCARRHTLFHCFPAPHVRTEAMQAAKLSCTLWNHQESWQESRLRFLVSTVAQFFFFNPFGPHCSSWGNATVTSAIIPVSAVQARSTWGFSAGDISWVHADRESGLVVSQRKQENKLVFESQVQRRPACHSQLSRCSAWQCYFLFCGLLFTLLSFSFACFLLHSSLSLFLSSLSCLPVETGY